MTWLDVLAVMLSCCTVLTMWLAGSVTPFGRRWAWSIGLPNQIGWCAWCALTGNWAILPLNLILLTVYSRNFLVVWLVVRVSGRRRAP